MEGGTTEVVAVATVFGVVVTKTVDVLRNTFDTTPPRLPKWTWNLVAFGLGIALALIWEINMLDNWSDKDSMVQGITGQILTGISIGGVSSGYHELFDVLSSTAKRAKYGPEAAP
jgi:hypothetical protein